MTVLAYALAIVALGGAIAVAVYAAKLYAVSKDRDVAKADALVLSQTNAAMAVAKENAERVVADLKAEIKKLEGELDACASPSVVRERLGRLLGGA